MYVGALVSASPSHITRSTFGYGIQFHSTASNRLKLATVAPIPSAKVITATALNPSDLVVIRSAYRRSRRKPPINTSVKENRPENSSYIAYALTRKLLIRNDK